MISVRVCCLSAEVDKDFLLRLSKHLFNLPFIEGDFFTVLEKYYGDQWYMYFFNTYHIAYSISKINENKIQTQQLKDIGT